MADAKKFHAKEKEIVSPEVKALRGRKVYLQVRLPKIREEMKAIGEERKVLSEKLKNAGGIDTAEQKNIRERGVYLSHHNSALRAELKVLAAERQTVGEKLRPKSKKA